MLKAFKDDLNTLYNDYFLLYDECERIVTDVDYRGDITAPLDVFFEFHNKALVSATTLPFSDERFKYFDHYEIVPDYDYSKPLTVISTNNVVSSLKNHLDRLDDTSKFIFFNSTDGIAATAIALDLVKSSRAYCSEDSVVNLKANSYPNGRSELDTNDLAKYNFLTSRYYSAVDIELDYKPDVVIVTDIYYAQHSIVDPHTEMVQIAGRFRNGVNSITHITNYKPTMETRTPEEAWMYLEGCLDTYDLIVEQMNKSKSKAAINTLKWFVKESPIAVFYTNGKRNPFMIDNDLHQERVKGYYVGSEHLFNAYGEVAKHFAVTQKMEEYVVGDGDFYNLKKLEGKASRNQEAARLLDRYVSKGDLKIIIGNTSNERAILTKKYPHAAEAVNLWGYENLKDFGFTTDNLKNAIKQGKEREQTYKLSIDVYKAIGDKEFIYEHEIVKHLTCVYEQHGLKIKPVAAHINKYYKVRRTVKSKVNGYFLEQRLNPQLIQKK